MADSAGPKRDTSVYLGQAASKLNSELKVRVIPLGMQSSRRSLTSGPKQTFLQVSNGLINNPSMKEAKQTMQAKNAVVKECTMVLKALVWRTPSLLLISFDLPLEPAPCAPGQPVLTYFEPQEEYEERTRQRYEKNPSKQGASLSGETVQALRNALGLR